VNVSERKCQISARSKNQILALVAGIPEKMKGNDVLKVTPKLELISSTLWVLTRLGTLETRRLPDNLNVIIQS
jgi:hypothetical protein